MDAQTGLNWMVFAAVGAGLPVLTLLVMFGLAWLEERLVDGPSPTVSQSPQPTRPHPSEPASPPAPQHDDVTPAPVPLVGGDQPVLDFDGRLDVGRVDAGRDQVQPLAGEAPASAAHEGATHDARRADEVTRS